MARIITLVAVPLRAPQMEKLRASIVIGCAMALILAGKPLLLS